jgi:hypothetical protein
MTVQAQIDRYVADQPPSKRDDIEELNRRILRLSPGCRLWFLDGRNEDGKVVSNPNIGYGVQTTTYANGETRDFYQVGISANTTGLSVYIMGLDDKTYLSETYGAKLGKAKVTGYCVKFRSLKDIRIDVLEEMIATHMRRGPARG